jgi:hypothetical protein
MDIMRRADLGKDIRSRMPQGGTNDAQQHLREAKYK